MPKSDLLLVAVAIAVSIVVAGIAWLFLPLGECGDTVPAQRALLARSCNGV